MLSFKDQIIYIQHTLQQIESFLPVLHSFECENYVSSKIDTYFQVFCNVLHNFYQEWDLNPRGLLPIGTWVQRLNRSAILMAEPKKNVIFSTKCHTQKDFLLKTSYPWDELEFLKAVIATLLWFWLSIFKTLTKDIQFFDAVVSWCSGDHICFTRRGSWVQSPVEPVFWLNNPVFWLFHGCLKTVRVLIITYGRKN